MVFMIEREIRCLFLVDMSSIINNAWISTNILFAKCCLKKTAKRERRSMIFNFGSHFLFVTEQAAEKTRRN